MGRDACYTACLTVADGWRQTIMTCQIIVIAL